MIFGIFILSADVTSWWRERLGGLLFISASIFFVVGCLVLGDSEARFYPGASFVLSRYLINLLRSWLVVGMPQLVFGALFLITAWLSRRKDVIRDPKSGTTADI
jgi:hypothetical protein